MRGKHATLLPPSRMAASPVREQESIVNERSDNPGNKRPAELNPSQLRKGWTTGACATAAAKAAFWALLSGQERKEITITLPGGQKPTFELAELEVSVKAATAGVIKDAGDDPDVTHGALIRATITVAKMGTGIIFKAGKGVGTVTKPGLPISPGEPAINPAPREMMRRAIHEVAEELKAAADIIIEISVPHGEQLAKKTWNPRLGIIGGISILGTTGIVVPYSCSAWIHSIQRGIDVARATGAHHIGAAVGATSEKLIIKQHQLKETELIDMGDFVGGMLKYIIKHPVPNLTIAGGFAKISKLANGAMDLHSKRSKVDRGALAEQLNRLGASNDLVAAAMNANTALEILGLSRKAGLPLANDVAEQALKNVREKLKSTPTAIEILICDREGTLVGSAAEPGFKP